MKGFFLPFGVALLLAPAAQAAVPDISALPFAGMSEIADELRNRSCEKSELAWMTMLALSTRANLGFMLREQGLSEVEIQRLPSVASIRAAYRADLDSYESTCQAPQVSRLFQRMLEKGAQ